MTDVEKNKENTTLFLSIPILPDENVRVCFVRQTFWVPKNKVYRLFEEQISHLRVCSVRSKYPEAKYSDQPYCRFEI